MEKDITGRGGKGGSERPAGKVLIDRKTVERNRRHHTKDLYAQLFSLVPPQHFTASERMLSLQDRIACATSYIKQLRERVEEQRPRREQAAIVTSTSQEYNEDGDHRRMVEPEELRLPVLELKEITGYGLQVNYLISKSCSSKNDKCSSTSCTILLSRSIRILHEEGAEVVSVSFVHRSSKVFYTIHAQVKVPRVGVETSRVRMRLEELLALPLEQKMRLNKKLMIVYGHVPIQSSPFLLTRGPTWVKVLSSCTVRNDRFTNISKVTGGENIASVLHKPIERER